MYTFKYIIIIIYCLTLFYLRCTAPTGVHICSLRTGGASIGANLTSR